MRCIKPLAVLAVGALTLGASPCDPASSSESLLAKVLRIFGVPATSGTKEGIREPPPAGFLEVTAADGGGSRIRLTKTAGYLSPIFTDDGEYLLALRQGQLVRVARNKGLQDGEFLMDLPGVTRLGGFSEDDPDLLIVLGETEGRQQARMLCLASRRMIGLDALARPKLSELVARLRGPARTYGDGTIVRSQANAKRGSDVFVVVGDRSVDVSKCDQDRCTQGARSADGQWVAFIRTPTPAPSSP